MIGLRIGFDAKRAFCNKSGLGNYSRNIIRAVAKYLPHYHFVLFTPKITIPEFLQEVQSYPNITIVNQNKSGLSGSYWRTYKIVNELKKHQIQLYHGLSNELPVGIKKSGIPGIVTIHDLIPFKDNAFQSIIENWTYQRKIKYAAYQADLIIAISKQTRDDLQQILKIHRNKIHVVYQPINSEFLNKTDAVKQKNIQLNYNLPNRFILQVGRIELRKNIHHVLMALNEIKTHTDLHLVCVGRKTKFYSSLHSYITNFKLSDRVHFLEEVETNDLPTIYEMSEMVMYPSLMEGFGLPIVEAIALKKPVITTEGGCFSEAGGELPYYVNPENVRQIADAILNIENNKKDVLSRISQGINHIETFSPPNIAEELGKIYALYDKAYLK